MNGASLYYTILHVAVFLRAYTILHCNMMLLSSVECKHDFIDYIRQSQPTLFVQQLLVLQCHTQLYFAHYTNTVISESTLSVVQPAHSHVIHTLESQYIC
jgi:hypothetical protein